MGEQGTSLSLRRELTRKGLHVLFVAVPIAYATGITRPFVVWTLVAALAIAVAVEAARAKSTLARSAFDASLGGLLREHEARGLSGATWLILAFLVTAVLFPRDIAIAAMCAVALGDAAAAIIGRTLGGVRAARGKSIIGSAACLVATIIAARWIANFAWHEALIAGLLASIAERARRPMDDNLRIALAVGCGILLWRMGFS